MRGHPSDCPHCVLLEVMFVVAMLFTLMACVAELIHKVDALQLTPAQRWELALPAFEPAPRPSGNGELVQAL